MQQVAAAQQVEHVHKQLTSALLRKAELEDQLTEVNRTITALRNVLVGVSLGQRLAQEMQSTDVKEPE